MYQINITHNFETAHRLSAPGSPEKCMSIHGHSWNVTLTLESKSLDPQSMVVEFGALKSAFRARIDGELDHYLVLQRGDPMAAAVRAVYPGSRILETEHSPTTERLAELLAGWAAECLHDLSNGSAGVRVATVHVQETRVNGATFVPGR
jgi:6-pyruvoyltetrahydropterin/6-carboxytetrahydropterin synthase